MSNVRELGLLVMQNVQGKISSLKHVLTNDRKYWSRPQNIGMKMTNVELSNSSKRRALHKLNQIYY